jgi:hypothetical protein
MTYYPNYDSWKLSNPDDDGYYQDDKPRIEEPIYYKCSGHKKRAMFGMITTSGYDIKVWDYGTIRTIDVDEIYTYVDDVSDEINRIRKNYDNFELITMQEFYVEFEQGHSKILKIVQDETNR